MTHQYPVRTPPTVLKSTGRHAARWPRALPLASDFVRLLVIYVLSTRYMYIRLRAPIGIARPRGSRPPQTGRHAGRVTR